MSKIEVQLIEELELRITRILAPVSIRELQVFAKAQADARICRNLIWDFAPGSLQLLTTDDLKSLLTARLDRVRKRAGGHTVVIAHQQSELTLLKWYREYAESLGVREVQFHVAKDMDEAMSLVKAT